MRKQIRIKYDLHWEVYVKNEWVTKRFEQLEKVHQSAKEMAKDFFYPLIGCVPRRVPMKQSLSADSPPTRRENRADPLFH